MNKLFQIFIISIFSIFWSLSLFYTWPSDYGIYYSMGNFINEDYRLYKEAFDTKGPAYLFFLKFIGIFIGQGIWQSFYSLFLTVILYFFSFLLIINKYVKDKFQKFFLIFLCIASLTYHDALSSISIFQSSMCIFSFYFLFKSLEDKKSIYFIISANFFILSVLTRVDTSVYAIVYFVFFLLLIKEKIINFNQFLILIFSNIFLIFLIFFYYQITPLEFYQANIDHYGKFAVPSNYKTKIYILIYRLDQFLMLTKQGLIPSFLFVLGIYFYKKYYGSLQYIKNSLALFLVIVGVIFSIYSESHSYRHIHIVVTPALFFIIYNFRVINLRKYNYIFATIIIILFSSNFYINIFKNVIINKCYLDILCENSKYKEARETILELDYSQPNKIKKIDIIGTAGWIYIFTKTKPNLAIMNWNLYHQLAYYPTTYTIKQHKELLLREKGSILWISKNILTLPSEYLIEITNTFKLIEDQGMFYKYKKK